MIYKTVSAISLPFRISRRAPFRGARLRFDKKATALNAVAAFID